MTYAQKCEKCGRIDDRRTWSSIADAGKDPAFGKWTCPMCAWTEFELVETDEAEQPVSR